MISTFLLIISLLYHTSDHLLNCLHASFSKVWDDAHHFTEYIRALENNYRENVSLTVSISSSLSFPPFSPHSVFIGLFLLSCCS